MEGAGKIEDVNRVFEETDVHSICCASIFHYDFIKKNATKASTTMEGNVEFLSKSRSFHNFETTTIPELKEELLKQGVKCRSL